MKFENGNFDEKDVSVAPIDFAFATKDIEKKRDEAGKVIKEIEKTTDELNKENEREAHMKNKFPSYKKLQLSESLFEDFEDEHVGKPSRKCKQCVKSVRKPLKEALSATDVARFIKNAVKGLLNDEGTNYRYILDDRLAIFVGWSEGYDDHDDTIIHNPSNKSFGINAGVKVWTSDDMWTDYDMLNFPYYANGDVIDTDVSIAPDEDYSSLANYLIDEYEHIKDLEIDKDGLIKENGIEEDYIQREKKSKLDESYVLLDLADFKPWSGAVPYWDKIVDADKIDEFDALLDDLYPEGIREVDLNDWLWFEGDDVLDMLGISDEDEDDDEESDEDEED